MRQKKSEVTSVRPCKGKVVFDGEFERPFQWKCSALSLWVSGRAQSSLALRGSPMKSAASRSVDAGKKRGRRKA
ncbi:MAG: hypothetical protein LUQ34_02620 [Euryarchaeota archaeon]|nr:hypothetical protein [Euryarchaeota archaeon]